ncbi:Zinc finger protein dzip1 [Cichlidogyrus casuarinus]|uniref:Zinc finger protein dzip1 n=1 Tax=Cichlidogyrus casuarinus TaxID=1844966 RepID=A0ABD2QAM9_9PLAT
MDIKTIQQTVNVDRLQECLPFIMNCDIFEEMYTQSFLHDETDLVKTEFKNSMNEMDELKIEYTGMAEKLKSLKHECHRRKLLILAQQHLLDANKEQYNKCKYCSKAFVSAEFLGAHMRRRHDIICSEPSSPNKLHLEQTVSAMPYLKGFY